jgi:hypothetical protein
MKAISFRIGATLVSGLVLVLLAASAQQNAPLRGDAQGTTAERDKEKEDNVAKLFEHIRAEAKVEPMQRIKHRTNLEESVCTSAMTNQPPRIGIAFYTTADPESSTVELMKAAAFSKRTSDNRPWYSRYSVAVWRTKDSKDGQVSYWVGLGFYGTALGEFVDCHFTDDLHYCGNWKKSIVRSCRNK